MQETTNIFIIDAFDKTIADEISELGKIAMMKLKDNITKQTLNID